VSGPRGVEPFYRGLHLENAALIAAIKDLTPEQLQLELAPGVPIWGSVAHLAGTRVFWLCHIFKEPGAETTPFGDPSGAGWEDDPSHPRSAAELVGALESTWRIVERVLQTWTPDTLDQEARRVGPTGEVRMHTRQSVLMRIITHEAYHCGEIALTLGSNGLGGTSPNGPIDMWAGLSRIATDGDTS
jgi:uncharacterized damage-inducible protein DinB